MELPKELNDEIWDYCRINKISDIDSFTIKLVKQGLTIEKYGATPSGAKFDVVEKEVIKEVIVEKEVIKEVKVSDDEQINELLGQITNLQIDNTKLKSDIDTLNKRIIEADGKLLIHTKVEEKKTPPTDIYNENRAKFGSNLLDK